MQITYAEPRHMSFSSIEEELSTLRKTVDSTNAKLEETQHKCETQEIQIEALRRTNRLATEMLSSVNTTASPSRVAWLNRNIQALTQKVKDLICDITRVTKDQIAVTFRNLYNVALEICNFIYDHFGTIVLFSALALAAAVILFDVVVLGAYVLGYAAPAAAAGAAIPLDFTLINSFSMV